MIEKKIIIPVGAITSHSYSFKNRNWKAWSLSTYSIFDPLMLPIKVDLKGSQITRILPKNDAFNIWISDKVRFAFDGLERHRFVSPMFIKKDYFNKKDSLALNILKLNFIPISWSFSFEVLKSYHKFLSEGKLSKINTFLGPFSDVYTSIASKKFTNTLGYTNVFLNSKNKYSDVDFLNSFNLNNLKNLKSIFFVGSNLRLENPTLNFFLNQFSKKEKILLICVGSLNNSLISKFLHLNNTLESFLKILEGNSTVCRFLSKNKNFFNDTLFLFGSDFTNRFEFSNFKKLENLNNYYFSNIFKNIKFNILDNEIGSYSALACGVGNRSLRTGSENLGENSLNYFVGTHSVGNLFKNSLNKLKKSYSVFIGHHNNNFLEYVDLVLPTFTYFEKDYKTSCYLNMFHKHYKNVGMVTSRNSSSFKYDWYLLIYILYGFKSLNFDSAFKILRSESSRFYGFNDNFKFYNFESYLVKFKFKSYFTLMKFYNNFLKSSINIYSVQNNDPVIFNSKTMITKFRETKFRFNNNNYYKFS